jgi:hypothetical protein
VAATTAADAAAPAGADAAGVGAAHVAEGIAGGVGGGGCAWRLAPGASVGLARGDELLRAGWQLAAVGADGLPNVTLALARANARVLEALLDARTPRCCGC